MRAERDNWIDSVKGISILAVIMPHAKLYELPGISGVLCSFGQYFIIPFLIISSYLSFFSYHRHIASGGSLCGWYYKKLIRLIPLYYLALFISYFGGGDSFWLGQEGHVTCLNLITHLLFIHGLFPHYSNSIIGVEWYLSVLVLFYLFVPLLNKYVNTIQKSFFSCVVSILFVTIISTIALHFGFNGSDRYIYAAFINKFSLWAEIPVLLLGLCFFRIKPLWDDFPIRPLYVWIALGTVVFFLIGQALNKNTLFGVGDLYLCSVFFFLILLFLSKLDLISDVVVFKPFRQLGVNSYALYLFHPFVYSLVKLCLGDLVVDASQSVGWLLVSYLLAACLTYVLSLLLMRFFDKPIRRVLYDLSSSGSCNN